MGCGEPWGPQLPTELQAKPEGVVLERPGPCRHLGPWQSLGLGAESFRVRFLLLKLSPSK